MTDLVPFQNSDLLNTPDDDSRETSTQALHPTTPERFQHHFTRPCKDRCGWLHWCAGHTNAKPAEGIGRHPCNRPPAKGLTVCKTHGAGLPNNRETQMRRLEQIADTAIDRLEDDIADPDTLTGGTLAIRLVEKVVINSKERTPLEVALEATRVDRTFPDQLAQAILDDPELGAYYQERMNDADA